MGSVSAANSAGCGRANPPPAGNYTIESGGLTRSYIISLPSTYSATVAHPLILCFHGNTRTAAYQQTLSGFDDNAVNPYAITVYPQGVNNGWQGAPYVNQSIDDIAFIGTLLDSIEATYCVDTNRLWAAGKSLGGGLINVLACSSAISTRFAAFAPVSAAFYVNTAADNSDCEPARTTTPILEFHGMADATIPYAGGLHNGVDLPAILDWSAHWATRNGCTAAPAITSLNMGNVTRYTWCGNTTQHYAIAGLGHAWPSTTANVDNATGTHIDATPLIMDFFNQHSLYNPELGSVSLGLGDEAIRQLPLFSTNVDLGSNNVQLRFETDGRVQGIEASCE